MDWHKLSLEKIAKQLDTPEGSVLSSGLRAAPITVKVAKTPKLGITRRAFSLKSTKSKSASKSSRVKPASLSAAANLLFSPKLVRKSPTGPAKN